VGGESTKAAFIVAAKGMRDSGWISDYDVHIASKVAHIVAGGNRWEGQTISEWELLDMEREAFMICWARRKPKSGSPSCCKTTNRCVTSL
jgi:3-hydroxyacyl-CoA dehydrogenase